MSNVSVISPLPVQPLDPVTEEPMDELHDRLVPVQEDELPQGVLELMAPLILRHRPLMDTGRAITLQAMVTLPEKPAAELDEVRPLTPVSHPQAQPLSSKPVQPRLLPPVADVAPVVDRVVAPTPTNLATRIVVEPGPTERPSNIVEPLPVERAASPGAPSIFEFEGQRPEALSSLPTARHVPTVASPAASASGMPPAPPALDPIIETLPVADRGLLQVPFNKGTASGQVTISRVADEPTRNLQLSPSNALVFEQLKVSLEHVREPAWRLTDSDGEQQRQGSRQPPDDEQTEDAGQGA
ncbi:invasion protein [Pseudomonas sp. KB_15]|uniref:SpaN/EivJ family type III secretion system needle length determinant n=1 Tax=Pseudomonas sp. KB_15 TaxID=3233035 RepID=UPI003F98339F